MALDVMDRLVDEGVKLLVIACNSATAVALPDARERYEVRRGIPVVEVIRPAARRAVAASRSGRIGVIGTQATIDSRAYEDAFAAAPGVVVTTKACPDFVPLVERGVTTGPELLEAAHRYLDPVRAADVDTLVLGCTHYPLLDGVISYVMGENVTLVSSAAETARDVYRTLLARGLERDPALGAPVHRFLATGDAAAFEEQARRFLGPEVRGVEAA
jgi:glutamate racemase